ncbi:MAG: GNAT family N-acetyltransferase [Desulfobacterales bacterium]|uniref:GNAT family N-acetyltransferase n=1 Tax=Candidatus Desulfatibia profunda TaxID=2841695 RepID=A0A8J6TNL6_9BACT|nr:GNAT family N-acetyltransferase [Candidatus Desulfatibia profunda]MBL7179300.1 GNAT family N-acetyltransferase [Desulfobacterales bacterium]
MDQVLALRRDAGRRLKWECLFMEPAWMQVWWNHFGAGSTPCILAVRHKNILIGIAPLIKNDAAACLLGSSDLCDYMDFIVAPQRESEFFTVLIEHLKHNGLALLNLESVRSDSSVLTELAQIAPSLGCRIDCRPDDIAYTLELPPSWKAFLRRLTGKQRHEIRRKLRRLDEAGQVKYRVVEDVGAVRDQMHIFLTLFRSSRPDKAAFMTRPMATYFKSLAEAMAARQMLKLSFLELDGQTVAAVMCFDNRSTVYLYNNGYDRRFRSLSVGLLSKIFSIKDSIQRGRHTYEFLKGNEEYKRHLGGSPMQLFNCQVHLNP